MKSICYSLVEYGRFLDPMEFIHSLQLILNPVNMPLNPFFINEGLGKYYYREKYYKALDVIRSFSN